MVVATRRRKEKRRSSHLDGVVCMILYDAISICLAAATVHVCHVVIQLENDTLNLNQFDFVVEMSKLDELKKE